MPRKGNYGHGKVLAVSSLSAAEEESGQQQQQQQSPPPLLLLNQDLLSKYKIDPSGKEALKAGDVIMAARPFVHAMATACRGQR